MLALAAATLSGCAGLRSGGDCGRLNAQEKMMWSTYPLVTQRGVSTAFIVRVRDPRASGGVATVMVSSRHALDTVGRAPFYIATRSPSEGGGARLTLLRVDPPQTKERFYVQHPRHDLAAFVLPMKLDDEGPAGVRSFLDERSVASPAEAARTGDEVFFLGFPEALPGTAGAFPILRSGRIASYPAGAPGVAGVFVLDADVYPGDSGAPVFARSRWGRPVLAGMITQRAATDRRGFSHLAIAVDANAIRETLQLLAARETARK